MPLKAVDSDGITLRVFRRNLMKWNGRYLPFQPEREENDPDRDFPMKEEFQDFAGKKREFEFTYHDVGLGYTVQAEEFGKDGLGYLFSAFSSGSPNLAWESFGARSARTSRLAT